MVALARIIYPKLTKLASINPDITKGLPSWLLLGAGTIAAVDAALQLADVIKQQRRAKKLEEMLETNNTKPAIPKLSSDKRELIDKILEKKAQLDNPDGVTLMQYKKELEEKSVDELEQIYYELQKQAKYQAYKLAEVASRQADESDPLTSLLLSYANL